MYFKVQNDSVNLHCYREDKQLILNLSPDIPASRMPLPTFLIQVRGSTSVDLIYVYGQMLPSIVILWSVGSSTFYVFEKVYIKLYKEQHFLNDRFLFFPLS